MLSFVFCFRFASFVFVFYLAVVVIAGRRGKASGSIQFKHSARRVALASVLGPERLPPARFRG